MPCHSRGRTLLRRAATRRARQGQRAAPTASRGSSLPLLSWTALGGTSTGALNVMDAVTRSSTTTGREQRPGRHARAPRPRRFGSVAVLRVLPRADLALLQEAVVEEQLVVLLRDPDRRQQDRLRAGDVAVDTLHRVALDDRDRGLRCCIGLLLDRLVDRARLPAGENELDAGRRRVLAGQRDRLQPVGLQRGDHGAGEPVVGGDRALDVVVVPRQHLVEDLAALDRVPVRELVAGLRLDEGAV